MNLIYLISDYFRLLPMSHPRLHDTAAVVAAPPCSLYGPASASVHQRSLAQPEGNLNNYKVRLARRIWINMAARHSIVLFSPVCMFCNVVRICALIYA